MALVLSCLLQFVFDLWQKKTGVMSPWNRTKNILHRDWLLNSHSESRGLSLIVYFPSFCFDQKTKYLVSMYFRYISNSGLGKWNSGQVIDFDYFTQIEHLICKVLKSIFSTTYLKKFGFTI